MMCAKKHEAKNILVVDDCELMLRSYKYFFSSFGCTFVAAMSGDEAVSQYRAAMRQGCRFDLVLVDLSLRDMSGLKLFKTLFAIDPFIKAMVVSGYSTDDVIESPKAYGFVSSLIKPFDLDELRTSVTSALLST